MRKNDHCGNDRSRFHCIVIHVMTLYRLVGPYQFHRPQCHNVNLDGHTNLRSVLDCLPTPTHLDSARCIDRFFVRLVYDLLTYASYKLNLY